MCYNGLKVLLYIGINAMETNCKATHENINDYF